MVDLLLDERTILIYLAAAADSGNAEHVSLKGILGPDKADLPREQFDSSDWERMADLYFAVRNLLMLGLVGGIAADGGEHLNRFRITDAGRDELAANAKESKRRTTDPAFGGFRVGENPWITHWRWVAVGKGVVLDDLQKMHQNETRGGVPTGKCLCGLPVPCSTAERIGVYAAGLRDPCDCRRGGGGACPMIDRSEADD
ncbi:hypothetical protein Caci_2929 [Catenulispora acidiphila DSM 44928]|uniref:Uncharacterized protein n=1 Tax=Catenulispora acidiphila (strain DSM 44928 / JCM 14897 / NBRC 102108 / NRRL B-24433 / ID139908) TaxID=479433 RepID=C7Q2U6_CATAD|nr:hypothetical protein [Catenulispora acidiphila]ACU71838.1 hypothetical protein Caci_2929 [Catenulispora acidiphila DSM 44928]